jgi:protein SCO1/2
VLLGACDREAQVQVPANAVIRLSDQFASDFELVDQDGAVKTNRDFLGKVMVIYFGFASCPDVCPMALSRLSAALNELSADEQAELTPVFITVDPERDTPEVLKSYLAFDERIIGLTGSAVAAQAARASFKVYAKQRPLPDSAIGYTMDHSSLFYLVERDGSVEFALDDSLNAQELAQILRTAISR